jgi:hypothetical protein
MATGISVSVSAPGFADLAARLDKGLDAIGAMDKVVEKWAKAAQAQAVRNVSGVQVTFAGGTFVVNRVTGKLAQSIQILPKQTPLTRIVKAGAEYADAIENGIRSFDMKPGLMGKTIPIRVAAGTPGAKNITLKNFAGGVSTNGWVIFRTVGPNSTGWIYPGKAPRPFMAAAAESIADKFRADVERTYKQFLESE